MEPTDYRDSHQSRGGHYDESILATPLGAHMDKWEGHHLGEALTRFFPGRIPRYLDFACGTGRITGRVAPLATESCGVDISESMLSTARGKCPSTRFVCADLTKGDVDLGLFDLVTSFRFFGNAQDELRASALSAIGRHLRPGGYLIINNHRNPRSFLSAAHLFGTGRDDLDLTHAKLKGLLHRHGFEIAMHRAIGFWIFRFKLASAEFLATERASRLERMFQHAWFAPFAPNSLIVARKTA